MSIQSSVNSALGSAAIIAGGVKAVQEEVKKKEAVADADQLAELQNQNKDLTKQAEQLQKDLDEAKAKISSPSSSSMFKEGLGNKNLTGDLQNYLHLNQRSQNIQLAQQANLKAVEEIKNRQENRMRAFSIIDNFRTGLFNADDNSKASDILKPKKGGK